MASSLALLHKGGDFFIHDQHIDKVQYYHIDGYTLFFAEVTVFQNGFHI